MKEINKEVVGSLIFTIVNTILFSLTLVVIFVLEKNWIGYYIFIGWFNIFLAWDLTDLINYYKRIKKK